MAPQTETSDVAMAESPADIPLLDEAVTTIQNTVLHEHRLDFHSDATASLLLDELRQISTRSGSADQRLVACSQKITLFIRNFAPYFDILSTCVKLRPEWAGWFWGTVRLVIKISSDYMLVFEKVADMLEAIAHTLPLYRQIYQVCNRRTSEPRLKEDDLHLATLMSYVYFDTVQLLLEIYRIFCRGTQAHTMSWRPLDSRLSRFEIRLSKHRRWLEKETENHVQHYADISHHRNNYLEFLHTQEQASGSSNVEQEGHINARRWRRVEKVRKWLHGSPESKQIDCRHASYDEESCAWFLQTPAYCNWRDQGFEKRMANDANFLMGNWQHRVLFVQAKVGFGKTVISYSVIENLAAQAEDPELYDEPPAVVHYHFSRLRSENNHPDDAFRAMACEILQAHHHDHSTLDTACLILRKTSFREHATTDEVLDVLGLLLRQHPTYIAIDGVDECNDMEGFFASLAKLCRSSDTRVILFSRPDLRIPLEYQKWASDAPHVLSLTSQHNAIAIESHVVPELNRLADQGFFGISMDRILIPRFAQAANGDFLWATMLLRFIQSAVLSSEERLAILENVQSLEGLPSLYHTILKALARRSQPEKRVIADSFRWLSYGINHMGPAALRAVLCLNGADAGESTHATDVVSALDELTCGLLLITDDRISFAHESIRDFLRFPMSQDSEFSLLDEGSVHAHLAARCLSYLVHDVPKRPLGTLQPPTPTMLPGMPTSSGASQRTSASVDSGYKSLSSSDGDSNYPVVPDVTASRNGSRANSIRTVPFDTHFPFLRYAALCWPIHLSRALSLSSHRSPSSLANTFAYLPTLSAFLSSRFAVTAWVEASFRYSLPPTLRRLVGPLSDLKGEVSPSTVKGRELRLAVNEMRVLSERLVGLKREHESIMRQRPGLIWQMDEPGGDAYWPVWEDVVATGSGR